MGRAEVANASIASVIYYAKPLCFVLVCVWPHWSAYRYAFSGRNLFHWSDTPFAVNTRRMKGLVYYGWGCADMCWSYDGEQVYSPFVRQHFFTLPELQSWIKRKLRQGAWHLVCCQTLTVRYQSMEDSLRQVRVVTFFSRGDWASTRISWFDYLEGLWFDWWTIFRNSCFVSAIGEEILFARDKIGRLGECNQSGCLRCAQNGEPVLHASILGPNIADLWVYVEHLSGVGSIRLSTESHVKIIPLPVFVQERQAMFIYLVAVVKEVGSCARLKGLRTDTWVFSQALIIFSFHL